MLRLLHIADVHLGATFSGFGDHAEARRDEVAAAFARLPRAAAERNAHAVLIAGDLFDGPRPPDTLVALARETVRRIVDDGRPVFIVPGNHDAITLAPNPYRDGLGGAHIFTEPRFGEPVRVETAGGTLLVYGLAFDPVVAPDPLPSFRRAEFRGVHVALLHGSVSYSPHWSGSPNALRLPMEALASIDVDYIALGDYHRFRPPAGFASAAAGAGRGGAAGQRPAGRGTATRPDADRGEGNGSAGESVAADPERSDLPGAGDPPACYAGSFAALNPTETGRRGWVIVELEPGQPPRVEHVSSGVREVRDVGDVDVTACESEVDVAGRVAERVGVEPAIPVVRLAGTPGFPLDPERVRIELAARFGHAWVRDESRYFASARLDELAREDTVVGHLVRLGRSRIAEAEAIGDETARETTERALRIALAALGTQ